VSAIQEGKVTKSYYSSSYGNVVFIKHGEYEAVYAHLNKRYVGQGDYISKGEKIGEVGNTGESRGAHLHLELHQGRWTMAKKNAMNPLLVLSEQRNEVVLKYVNRLSDYLFAVARVINARLQVKDVEYNRSAIVFRDKKEKEVE